MKKKDLRDLLSRAAAVIEDPESESKEDREQLAEDLHQAAEDIDRFEIVPPAKSDVERFRMLLKNDDERALYTMMVERAGRDPEYNERFLDYIRNGSTLELRELARPFGEYWEDLAYSNVVCGIDSAHLYFSEMVRLNDEPGWEWDEVQKTYVRI